LEEAERGVKWKRKESRKGWEGRKRDKRFLQANINVWNEGGRKRTFTTTHE
jgi:hypothetical protein